jgi:PAS domain S-box-containing protein
MALVPALGVGAAGAWLALGSYQRSFEDRLRDTARGVALVIEREIATHVSTLSTLAASPLLDGGPGKDLGSFLLHARRTAESVGSSVELIGTDLRTWIDTDRVSEPGLLEPAALETARTAFRSGRPAVSNLLTSAVSGRPAIIVQVPVLRAGRVIAVIGTRVETARLSAILAASDLSGSVTATIADGQNLITARSEEAGRFVGRATPAWYSQAIAGHVSGFASGKTLAEEEVKLAFQAISGTPGWTLMVLEPVAAYHASWLPPITTLMLGGTTALVLALVFAMWLGRRVLKPIVMLQQQAEAVAAGEEGGALGQSSATTRRLGVAEFEALREAIGRAGETVVASERRHRALAETGAAGLWRAMPDGYMLEIRGWEALTGQKQAELRGNGWLAALHPDDTAAAVTAWRVALEERKPVSVEYRVRTLDGRWHWHRARGVPILNGDGHIEEWFGVLANTHDRKNAEAALAASEARMRALVDTAPDAIVVMDVSGIVQSFNQGAERIFGYAAVQVIGRNISALLPAPDARGQDNDIAHYLRTGEPRVIGGIIALNGLRKDGAIIPLEASIGEWQDAEGARFFTGVLRDITERRAAEEKQALLTREVDHRAKNALTVVQSLLRLTPASDAQSFAAAVEARVAALARVHSLLAQEGWMTADLRVVAERELAAHAREHEQGEATELAGPLCRLASTAVQPIAMVLHELATNAAKHGAFSVPGGKVRLVWDLDTGAGQLRVQWEETGGPQVTMPIRRGFGSRVIEATIRSQLGGTVTWHWKGAGLVCELALPFSRVLAGCTPLVAEAT